MSFRNRLALFFVVIVIVPMLAVAFLLFRLIDRSSTGQAEATIQQQHRTANRLFGEQRELAQIALQQEVGRDRRFAAALRDGDIDRARGRIGAIVEHRAIQRILFVRDGKVVLRAGNRRAIAPAVRPVQTSTGRRLGRLEVSVTDARAYVRRMRELTGLHTVVLNGGKALASTLPAAAERVLRTSDGDTFALGGTDYRVHDFTDPGAFSGQKIRVVTLGSLAASGSERTEDRTFAGVILLSFFLLAIACAMLVSRTLQQQIAAFLTAARRLGAGDFSAQVPTVGRDEFAALGEEFNKMSRELAGRLAELSEERGRVLDAVRRIGDAAASGLDLDATLAIVVRSAGEGVRADAGRIYVRANGNGTIEERSRVGDVDGLEAALQSVEAEALRSGRMCERTTGAVSAIAQPLHAAGGTSVVGVLSVARNGSSFSDGDRDLLAYLAGQAARSIENVELHETTARRSVTDERTGLANDRAFEGALADELERARRLGGDLGLVMIDLDDFKVVNDTYGHPQGDAVLREVARVLRESSREIDFPARYGGEEFAVLLPGTEMEGAYVRAERVRKQIEELRVQRLDGAGALRITASCGVADVRVARIDRDALVNAADAALLEAKRTGKNKTVRAKPKPPQ